MDGEDAMEERYIMKGKSIRKWIEKERERGEKRIHPITLSGLGLLIS